MPRIVPSQVVASIDRAFPGARSAGSGFSLAAGQAASVAAILAQVRAVPDACLALLDSSEHALYVSAIAAIESALRAWEMPSHPGLQTPLVNLGQLDNRHPFHIIRAALAKCPDEATGTSQHRLAFVQDEKLARALESDIQAAESALSNAEFKAATVLAGSVVEALLLWAISRKSVPERTAATERWMADENDRKAPRGAPEEWSLSHYIAIGGALGIFRDDVRRSLALCQEYRNLIHPGRSRRLALQNTRATATIAVGAMLRLVDEFLEHDALSSREDG